MARYCGEKDSAPIVEPAEWWKTRCLEGDGSVFTEQTLWNEENLESLNTHFVNKPDAGEGTFFEKLETQLEPVPASGKTLAAEMLWVLLLCPSNISSKRKRENVELVWSWGSTEGLEASRWLQDDVLQGIGSAGTAYNTQRWRELAFLIRMSIAFKQLSPERRSTLLNDPWEFAEWLEGVEEADTRQFRHMLVYMLFPDTFERIFGGTDRYAIASHFMGDPKRKFRAMSPTELDQVLSRIRSQKEQEYGTKEIDFYVSPLKQLWSTQKTSTWLLSWNPEKWEWTTLRDDRDATHAGETITRKWTCRNSNAKVGNRVFLRKVGDPPRGIIAVGNIVTGPHELPHWDPEKAKQGIEQQRIEVAFTRIQDPSRGDKIVTQEQLAAIDEDNQDWTPQASGIEIKPRAAAKLHGLWSSIVTDEVAEPPEVPYSRPQQAAVNIVYYGPPGTGKTWLLRKKMEEYGDRYDFITFHQAYSYEDFIEGIRPIVSTAAPGGIEYRVVPGVFRLICERAAQDPDNQYALFIDEINRGNIAKIFGELITLVETDKRAHYHGNGQIVSGLELTLPYSQERFGVPDNLDVWGAMNTADRSIALLDAALRRRFQFVELLPEPMRISGAEGDGIVRDESGEEVNVRAILEAMNLRIESLLSRDMTLGHSYFMNVRTLDELKSVFLRHVIPLLQEYFYNDWNRIQLVLRDVGPAGEPIEPQIVQHRSIDHTEIMGFESDDSENHTTYDVCAAEDLTGDSFRKIYERLA